MHTPRRALLAFVTTATLVMGATVPTLIAAVPAVAAAQAPAPAKVSTVALGSRTSSKVTVSWSAAKRAARYQVKIGSKTTRTTHRSVKVTAATGAAVRVRSVSSAGRVGPWSNVRYVQPVAPSKPAVAVSLTSTVTVSWPKVSGATAYTVSAGSKSITVKKTSAKVTASASTVLKVRALGNHGTTSTWSTTAYRKPVAPSHLSARTVDSATAVVSWSAVAGASQYQVTAAGGSFSATSTAVTVYALHGDSIKVRAKGKGGWSPWSTAVTKKLSGSETAVLRQQLSDDQTELSEVNADITQDEYWLSVAVEYGDTARADELNSELAGLRSRKAALDKEIAAIQATLAKG